jgi:NAD(P)-dependent dehydrogenase (short-subunit alcohol dehydrogenase family)
MQAQGQNDDTYSIVNTSSVAGLRGTPAMVAYASSKAAVLAMTVSTSKDLAPYGIRVNAVSPALIGPGFMWDRQNELHAKSGSPFFATDPEVVAKNKVNSVPMKRLGSTKEVIQSVAFLLSDHSSYTTGTNLVIDGGMSAGLKC